MKFLKPLGLVLLLSLSLHAQKLTKNSSIYAVTNVNIIPMTENNTIIKNATVIIQNHKIEAINAAIPESAIVIDGTNKWLIPGLIDMHVHTNASVNFKGNAPAKGDAFFIDTQDVMTTYIANGVTTIFELGGRWQHFAQRNEIAKGDVIGPRMAIAPMINGGSPNDGPRIVNTASDARQAVRSAKSEGYQFIKVYSHLNEDAFYAIMDEAKIQGLKVVGHIPDTFKDHTEDAFVPQFGLVAHFEEFSKQIREQPKTKAEAQRFAKMAKANDTWVIPNLIAIEMIKDQVVSLDVIRNLETLKYVHPLLQDKWLNHNNYHKHSSEEFITYLNELIAFHKEMIKAFKAEGVPMVAGTDAGTSGIVTGFSLHDELELMVDAGLTNEETLIAATRTPAQWLSIADQVGTIQTGHHADLILLDNNPLKHIKHTRDIHGIFVNGQWLNRKQLNQMLSNLLDWNTTHKSEFLWENRRN